MGWPRNLLEYGLTAPERPSATASGSGSAAAPVTMQLSYTSDEIAAIVQPRAARGATAATIRGISALGTARAGDLSFLGNPKYKAEVARTGASIVLVPPDYAGEPAADQLFLVVDEPSVALARLCARIEQTLRLPPPPGRACLRGRGPGRSGRRHGLDRPAVRDRGGGRASASARCCRPRCTWGAMS